MPSSFSFFKSANTSDRRSSTVSIDSSRSSNGKSSLSHSPSSKSSTIVGTPAEEVSRSTSRNEDRSQQQTSRRRQILPSLSTKPVPASQYQPLDPTRSSSVPSIDITSPSSDQPKPLFHPGQEDSSPQLRSSSFSSLGEQTPVPHIEKQGFQLPSVFAQEEEEEDRLFSISPASSQRSMPRSSSVNSKSRGEPGGGTGKKADRHDVMRRAMAEATSSDAFGNSSNESGVDDRSPSKSSIAPSISAGSMVDHGARASNDKIGRGSLSFEHFGQQGAEGEVVHADGSQTQGTGNASGVVVPSTSQDSQAFPTRPKMGPRADSYQSEMGQDIPTTISPGEMNTQSPAKSNNTRKGGGQAMESSNSRGSSLTVPDTTMSTDPREGGYSMQESASTGKLLHSPIKRFRKLSDSGSVNGSPKPSSGIAGAIAASSMAGMGVGHKNVLQQSQPSTTKEKNGSRQSSVGGEFVSGYEGGLYRDPIFGKMVEKGPEQRDGDGIAKRAKFARDRSATASTLSLAGSDYSIGSGLHAAANFSPTSAANLGFSAGFLTPEEVARRANEGGAPALTPGGIGAVGGLSPDGHGERVGLGDEEPWSGSVGSQITGFAVASSKRNADFHNLFTSVPEDDYLIEDYGCALVREILIQGRLYVSENHVCFYANIFGWVTNIVLPFSEIVSTEKRMTAYVIPNAIQIATLHSKQTFASFLSRDTTFDLIVNIWKLSHPGVPTMEAAAEVNTDDESVDPEAIKEVGQDADKTKSDAGHDDSHSKKSKRKLLKKKLGIKENENNANGGHDNAQNGNAISRERSPQPGNKKGPHRKTSCPCEKDKRHYSTICIDTTYPAVPEKIYNLIFTSGFMKEFWSENQKLMDLQMSDWAPDSKNDNALTRNISYIKPLTGTFGPKQTKCLLTDENVHVDFDDYVVALTTTRTPDVPSGGSFSVKTRTCLTWAGGNVTKLYVTCQVDWTGRSMVKGIIERASIDGQKQYYKDLDVAIRKYIKEHASEFREEGDDQNVMDENTGDTSIDTDDGSSSKEKEMDSSEKGATETKDGMTKFIDFISNVSTTCFETISGAVGMISDLTGGVNPGVLILGFVVFLLVISNLWAMKSPSGRDPLDPHRLRASPSHRSTSRSHYRQGDTETAHAVAIAVREVLQDYFEPSHKGIMSAARVTNGGKASLNVNTDDPLQEIQDLLGLLDTVEQRVTNLREQLKSSSAGQSSAGDVSKKSASI